MKTTSLVRTTAAAALLALAVTACGGEVTATPVGPSYSPPDPATATAQSIDLEKAVAVSRDGAQVAVIQDKKFCIRLRVPSGAKGSTATCADDSALSGRQPAVFSPSGSRIVVFDNPAESRGRAWIVESTSGTTVPITLPAPTSRSTSSPGPTTTSSSGTGSTGVGRQDAAVTYLWQSDDALYAVGLSGAVYRVTPSTGTAVLLTPGGDRKTESTSTAVLGGGTIAMVQRRFSGGGTRLVTVSVADGTVRDPAVEFAEDIHRPMLMGVSPDGTKALVSTADLQNMVPGETGVYDLVSGRHAAIPGTERSYTVAGAFSPDGSVVALVASGTVAQGQSFPEAADGNRIHLQLAPADAGTAPRDLLGADEQSSTLYGPLVWSATGWLVTAASPVPAAAAWTIGG